jgi:hypothetical protein
MNTKKTYISATLVALDAKTSLPIATSLPVSTNTDTEIDSEDDILVRSNPFADGIFTDVED